MPAPPWTDQAILTAIQYVLMEPPDGGATWPSGLWTRTEVLTILQEREAAFLKASGILVGTARLGPITPGQTRLALPDDWIGTVGAVWEGEDGTLRPLTRSDSFALDHGDSAWAIARDTPLVYADYATPMLELQIGPAPDVPGWVQLRYVAQGAPLDGSGEVLTLPDPYVDAAYKYGTLADLFGKDGRGENPEKAAYCELRFRLGVDAARLILTGWTGGPPTSG